MSTEQSADSTEYSTILHFKEILRDKISEDPSVVSEKLFKKQLISEQQHKLSVSESKDDYSKAANTLLDAVLERIRPFPDPVSKSFLSALVEIPLLQDVTRDIQEAINKAKVGKKPEKISELPSADIKAKIQEAMKQEDIQESHIPTEVNFKSPQHHYDSKRYFKSSGFAWFICPSGHHWYSSMATCFIDLKKQTICYRTEQTCKDCSQKALPIYADDAIEKMARNVVIMYKTGLTATKQQKYDSFVDEIFQAAGKDTKCDRKHAHSMFIGPGNSGKTSLMKRLTGRRERPTTSTGVATAVVMVNATSDTWETVELNDALVGQIHESIHTEIPANPQNPTAGPVQVSTPDTVSTPLTGQLAIDKDIKHAIESTVKRFGGPEKFESFWKNKFSLYLRDAGGQVEFQEMVSLLVFGPSIFFFVFRADVDFDSTFAVNYRMKDGEPINSYPSSITIRQALLQSLASVYAMDMSRKASIEMHKPYVFIVATHKDMLGPSADQKIERLNEDLDSLILGHGFENLVQYASKKEVMFVVNNLSDSDDDFNPIKKKVHTLIDNRQEFNIEYPIKYLFVSLELQSKQNSVFLSLDEWKTLVANYKFTDDQESHLRQFLHLRIGVIQFLDNIEGVSPIALKRPEYLFNKVTNLATKTFLPSLTTKEDDDFEKKGILRASAIRSIIGRHDDIITGQEFIQILVHLRIITKLSTAEGEDEYFIPCILNHVSESTENLQDTDIMPLAVKFKCNHSPRGLFGVLITHLLDDNSTFQLNKKKIFKDQVSLTVNSVGVEDEISFKAHSTHFEIRFFPEQVPETEQRDTSKKKACTLVREKIEQFIEKSIETLHYKRENVTFHMCLKCSLCSEYHKVKKGINYYKIHCKKERRGYRIPKKGRFWFNEDCDDVLQSSKSEGAEADPAGSTFPLTHSKIRQYLQKLDNTELISVGVVLGLHYPRLKRMSSDSLLDDMVNAWLRGDDDVLEGTGKPSWESLRVALRLCGHNGIARDIRFKESQNDDPAGSLPPPQGMSPLSKEPTPVGQEPHSNIHGLSGSVGANAQTPEDDIQSIDDSLLEIDDLGDVLDEVETLSARWRLLSTKLRLRHSTLDKIQHDHPGDATMCLCEALREWLKLNYDHHRHGKPSWRKLAEAVRNLDYRLFKKIAANKNC